MTGHMTSESKPEHQISSGHTCSHSHTARFTSFLMHLTKKGDFLDDEPSSLQQTLEPHGKRLAIFGFAATWVGAGLIFFGSDSPFRAISWRDLVRKARLPGSELQGFRPTWDLSFSGEQSRFFRVMHQPKREKRDAVETAPARLRLLSPDKACERSIGWLRSLVRLFDFGGFTACCLRMGDLGL